MRLPSIAAFAVLGLASSVTTAFPANPWPSEVPAAHAWFMCSTPQGDAFVAWVDANDAVTAVGALREDMPTPSVVLPMLHEQTGNRHHIQRTKAGFHIKPQGAAGQAQWTMQVQAMTLNCGHARDE